MRTVSEAQRWARAQLSSDAAAAALREIDSLLAHVLSIPLHDLYLSPDRPIDVAQARRFQCLFEERLDGRPLQLLLGETEFLSLTFRVSPGVFIPRPETETLVESVLERTGDGAGVWIDMGTGTGIIGISLAVHRPRLTILATDVSMDALRLADENARRNGVGERVRFLRGSLLDPLRPTGSVDGIVANSPYISSAEMNHLPPEVRDHDPSTALHGGEDGLLVIRPLVSQAVAILRPGGTLALEIGEDQADSVMSLFASGWDDVELRKDLADRPRVVLATRS